MNIDLNETEIRQILEGVEPKTALDKLRAALPRELTVKLTLRGTDVDSVKRGSTVLLLTTEQCDQLRSQLSEPKPVEPTTVVLGPDTKLGWYRVVEFANGGTPNDPYWRCFKLTSSARSEVIWLDNQHGITRGAILEPVPEPRETGEDFGEAARSFFVARVDVMEWSKRDERRLAGVLREWYEQGRADERAKIGGGK